MQKQKQIRQLFFPASTKVKKAELSCQSCMLSIFLFQFFLKWELMMIYTLTAAPQPQMSNVHIAGAGGVEVIKNSYSTAMLCLAL